MAEQLTEREREALEAAIEDGAIADENPDRALVQGADRGWRAARDFYRAEGEQPVERLEVLRCPVCGSFSDSAYCAGGFSYSHEPAERRSVNVGVFALASDHPTDRRGEG